MIHRIGWACVTYQRGLSTNTTFRLQSLSPEKQIETALRNVDALEKISELMLEGGFRLFRIGQSLVPFASHPAVRDNPAFDWRSVLREPLAAIGEKFIPKGFRYSMHPAQFAVLNSPRPEVVKNTIAELSYSCEILEMMGLDTSHKLVVHGGAAYGDHDKALAQTAQVFHTLPDCLKDRIIFENDEHVFTLEQILALCEETGAPPVFDIFHHNLFPGNASSPDALTRLLQRVHALWRVDSRHGRPKVHLSSQMPDARIGKHSIMIDPPDTAQLCEALPFDADLMVEAKGKQDAAFEVQQQLLNAGCHIPPDA